MGYCKLECPDGETKCCVYCQKHLKNIMNYTRK